MKQIIEQIVTWSTKGQPRCPHEPHDTHFLRRTEPLACEKCLAELFAPSVGWFKETVSWALDLIDLYDAKLVELGEPHERVHSPTHVAGKELARTTLRHLAGEATLEDVEQSAAKVRATREPQP